jgi:two-component system, OmpR family, sensor kinase
MTEPSTNEEGDLARANAELREAVRARDEFLAIAAHELRSPMHALLLQMTSVVEIARRGSTGDLVPRLERVRQVVERYVKRATTLLEISRINAGQLQLRFEHVDFATVVREVVESYATEAAYHGARINLTTPDVLYGRWDRLALEQIVTNLVSNAIKYGDGKPVDVKLVLETPCARLEVQDRGIGIPAADQARVFNRFEQVVTAQTHSGFGIGLWLVRTLIDAHHGSIEIESAPRQGATFTVRLPLDSAPREPEAI